jgi:hypothetical protein
MTYQKLFHKHWLSNSNSASLVVDCPQKLSAHLLGEHKIASFASVRQARPTRCFKPWQRLPLQTVSSSELVPLVGDLLPVCSANFGFLESPLANALTPVGLTLVRRATLAFLTEVYAFAISLFKNRTNSVGFLAKTHATRHRTLASGAVNHRHNIVAAAAA